MAELHQGIYQQRDAALHKNDLSGDRRSHPGKYYRETEAGRGSHLPPSPCGSPGLDDPYQHGRGVALADFNRDGRVDIVYGNWNGPHRLYLQSGGSRRVRFRVRTGTPWDPQPLLALPLNILDWEGQLHPDLALSPSSQ